MRGPDSGSRWRRHAAARRSRRGVQARAAVVAVDRRRRGGGRACIGLAQSVCRGSRHPAAAEDRGRARFTTKRARRIWTGWPRVCRTPPSARLASARAAARSSWSSATPRTCTFSFKPANMKAMGESLGAQYLLLGQMKKDDRAPAHRRPPDPRQRSDPPVGEDLRHRHPRPRRSRPRSPKRSPSRCRDCAWELKGGVTNNTRRG